VTLTYHRGDRRMLCHYCNYAIRVPDRCPKCDSEYLQFVGRGQRTSGRRTARGISQGQKSRRLDRDTVGGKHDYETILSAFREHEFDVLVGTQDDCERSRYSQRDAGGDRQRRRGTGACRIFAQPSGRFQLLTQAAGPGRARRGLREIVLIQTINPDHYAVRLRGRPGLRSVLRQGDRVSGA